MLHSFLSIAAVRAAAVGGEPSLRFFLVSHQSVVCHQPQEVFNLARAFPFLDAFLDNIILPPQSIRGKAVGRFKSELPILFHSPNVLVLPRARNMNICTCNQRQDLIR
ncbi:unnamed protein product [Linum trigynum]|uniref:Secreted protein n=1 Tax=Linum trigynum TaxID=586398 RepID=A0AAV2D0A1_9ROSI